MFNQQNAPVNEINLYYNTQTFIIHPIAGGISIGYLKRVITQNCQYWLSHCFIPNDWYHFAQRGKLHIALAHQHKIVLPINLPNVRGINVMGIHRELGQGIIESNDSNVADNISNKNFYETKIRYVNYLSNLYRLNTAIDYN